MLPRHPDRHDATALALRAAGPAIVASALTVIAALLVGFPGIDPSLLLFAFVLLVALGVDHTSS